MGNTLDCFYATRQYNQCFFPCIRCCSYSHRRIFYNFDGMEMVQPLVHFYFPKKSVVRKFPGELESCAEEEELEQIIKNGVGPVEQLCAICFYASKNKYTVRAVGAGASWSRITSTRDILIDMKKLDRILTKPPSNRRENLAKEYVDIEVEGGKIVVDFVEELDAKYGLGIPMIGNYAGQTVAGVASTSTHGSGYFAGTLSTSVVGLHLITNRGIQVRIGLGNETFEECKQKLDNAQPCGIPVMMKSTTMLKGTVVGLGSLGIVYSITYRCIPMFNLEETRSLIRIPWSGKESFRIRERFTHEFTDPNLGEYFSFFINPYPQPRSILYGAVLQSKRTPRRPVCCKCCLCWCGSGGRGCSECGIVQNDCTTSCLQSCANCCPSRVPDITNFGLSLMDRADTPFVHKYYNVLQFTNGNVHVRTAEWCLPLSQMDAALADVIDIANQYAKRHQQYCLLPIYVRMARTDELLLSPANRKFASGDTEHCCYIEVPFTAGAFGTDEYQGTIEELLFKKYNARPHWAKNNQLCSDRVKKLYPDFNEWQKIFKLFNKDGTFCNEFTRRMGFDESLVEDAADQQGHANNNVTHVQPHDTYDDVISQQPNNTYAEVVSVQPTTS